MVTRENQVGTHLEAYSLSASFHNVRKCYACYQSRQVIVHRAQVRTLQATMMTHLEKLPTAAIMV